MEKAECQEREKGTGQINSKETKPGVCASVTLLMKPHRAKLAETSQHTGQCKK